MSFIHRQHPTTDESPPWDGIAFRLPIDSDLLAESLKSKYPHHRTLRQRKYQATIDFFLGELSQMQSRDSISVPMLRSGGLLLNDQPIPTSATFIPAVSDQSRPQSASECTSPSIKGSSTSPQSLEFLNPGSSLASNTNLQPPTTTSSSSHFVWNAHDGRAARPKTKRKMTVEERSAYKETRKRGACSRCRKQKGKCTHMIDGDPQPTENETFKSAKRISGEIEQDTSDGLKTVKTEHASDVHHLTMTQPLEHESSTVMQTSANVDESVAQLAIQPSPKQWEREPQIEASAEVSSPSVPTDRESNRSRSHESSTSPTPTNSRAFSPPITTTTTE
ncbi:unnamed protein product [Periconia digitata]|uniref:Uncharacterized protein n=1 Tax=Periconia digitata TaxID=1303443 RepID=A0A9W4UC34_9PLEO|nr:unnamed protein product [Periconia digitata]